MHVLQINKKGMKHTSSFWLFILPSLLLFTIFFLIPLVLSVAYSFTNYNGWKTMDFVGLDNFIELFQDKNFYSSLGRTFVYTLFSLPFKVIIPLLIAVLVCSDKVALKGFSRTLIYVPVLLSSLVIGITINWMFSTEYGLINYLLTCMGLQPLDWALNPYRATFVISFASNWASTGFYMIIFIGGLKGISKDLYEASSIDGCTASKTFFKVTLPMLAPTTFLAVLLATVNLLKEYALVQGITQGGPGNTTTFIIQYIFGQGFDQMRYGYASAISMIVMIIFALIAFIQFKLSNKGGDN